MGSQATTRTTTTTTTITNCAANLIQKSLVQKRQQLDGQTNQSIGTNNSNNNNSVTTLVSSGPRLLLAIECKDSSQQQQQLLHKRQGGQQGMTSPNHRNNDEIIHFDLYNKRDTHFIKHLTSYPATGDQQVEQVSNVSLMLDLGQDGLGLADLAPEDIESEHVIVMSVTDRANNRLKQPNVTLHFTSGTTGQGSLMAQPSVASRFLHLLKPGKLSERVIK